MPEDKCSVKYHDLDYAVQAYFRVLEHHSGQKKFWHGCYHLQQQWRNRFDKHKRKEVPIFAGKSDLKSAFRILGLNKRSWRWLVFKAQDPLTGDWKYFVDKCLPFSASISCAHFQRFSNALCHLMEIRTDAKGKITNYLDDFLFLALSILQCNDKISKFIDLCREMGVPVSMEKTEWANEEATVIFLGILLDRCHYMLRVPLEKKEKALSMLHLLMDKKKSTVKDLQALCGYLNFISKAVFSGRTFTRRMYAKFSEVVNIGGHPKNASEYRLKQHHHVRLDMEFKLDCAVWCDFLAGELNNVINQQMVDLTVDNDIQSTDIGFYSDASASEKLSFGCILGSQWQQQYWEKEFIKKYNPSIENLELYALVAGVITWENCSQLNNARVVVHCNNQAVVNMINGMTSSCKNCMRLLRILILSNLKANRRLTARFVWSKDNGLVDALSRGQWDRFRALGLNMNSVPTPTSPQVWPMSRIWVA